MEEEKPTTPQSESPNPTVKIDPIPYYNNSTAQQQFLHQPQQTFQNNNIFNNNIFKNNNNQFSRSVLMGNLTSLPHQLLSSRQKSGIQQGTKFNTDGQTLQNILVMGIINSFNINPKKQRMNPQTRQQLLHQSSSLSSNLLSQKSGILQGTQFNTDANSAGKNMQAMGMINPLNINPQTRTNETHLGSSTQQQRMNLQMRHQLLHQANLDSNPPRQKSGILQGTKFNTDGQTLQNILAMGMINPLNINPKKQRMNLQTRKQLLHQGASLSSNPPSQKSGILQGTQFNTDANSAGQNMQTMGMINPLNINPQTRTNETHLGSSTQQQRMNLQMRHQLLHQANLDSNPKLAAQGLQRTPYMNAQLSGLNQGTKSSNQLLGKRKIQYLVSQSAAITNFAEAQDVRMLTYAVKNIELTTVPLIKTNTKISEEPKLPSKEEGPSKEGKNGPEVACLIDIIHKRVAKLSIV